MVQQAELAPYEVDSESGIGRRALIKRAAAAGALAWSAPVIIDSLASPAAANTLAAACYKVEYNWSVQVDADTNLIQCLNGVRGPAQVNTTPCTFVVPAGQSTSTTPGCPDDAAGSSTHFYKSNESNPNRNCCQAKDTSGAGQGNSLDWWTCLIADFPNAATCIIVESSTGSCSYPDGGFKNGGWIRFTMDHTKCPNCYLADSAIVYSNHPLPGNACNNFSFGGPNQNNNSQWTKSLQFDFTSSSGKYPIHVKFWVSCNMNWGVNGEPPNTQCNKNDGTHVIQVT